MRFVDKLTRSGVKRVISLESLELTLESLCPALLTTPRTGVILENVFSRRDTEADSRGSYGNSTQKSDYLDPKQLSTVC